MNTQKRYPREVRERAVRMVFEHKGEYDSQGAAIGSVATKLGMTAETLRKWVRRSSGSSRSARSCRSPLPPTMPRRPASRKVWRELGRQGFQVARCTVERLMRALEMALWRRGGDVDGLTIKGLHKTEVISKRGPWKTLEDVEFATLEWVDWFNNRRLLEYTDNIPPAEFEEMYYREQALLEDEGLKQLSLIHISEPT